MGQKFICGKCGRADFAREQNAKLHEKYCKGKKSEPKAKATIEQKPTTEQPKTEEKKKGGFFDF